jgi:hypothetical protein
MTETQWFCLKVLGLAWLFGGAIWAAGRAALDRRETLGKPSKQCERACFNYMVGSDVKGNRR